MKKSDENEYAYYLRVSLGIALAFVILVFYLFPDFQLNRTFAPPELDVQIFVEDIPKTEQLLRPQRKRQILVSQAIPVPVEQEDFPQEITLDTLMFEVGAQGEISASSRGVETPAKPILEIYPEVSKIKCRGNIKLLLLVSRSGTVEEAQVLENTTQNPDCLKRTLEAAMLSKWIPAKVNKENVSSWVVKEYKFNIN